MQLQDKAVLVKLSFSLPGNSRTDKALTDETLLAHALGPKAGRWLKQIFPDDAIEPLTKMTGAARTWNDQNTLPWSDEGFRILPTAHHADYTAQMRTFRREFETARDAFLSKLPEWVSWARAAHNGTFDASLYEREKLAGRFGMRVDFSPVPSGDDFRCELTAEERATMAEQVNERVTTATREAQAELWRRLAEPLGKLAAKLSEERANGKAPIFRDTLVSNLSDIAALVPQLNLSSDSQLSRFADAVRQLASSTTPFALRESATTRQQTAERARAILANVAGYMPS